MAEFKNYQFYNFSGGLDLKNSSPLIGQTEKKVFWANGYNVELLQSGGIAQMKGSKLFSKSLNEEIIGGFQGEQNGNKFLVVTTKSGKFYYYTNGDFVLKKSDLAANIKASFKTYLNGVLVSNGVDEPFLFMPNNEPEILSTKATTSSGHKIRGNAVEIYKGRIWIADGASLYYSALGKYDDWTSENDAGSISNFHNDTSKITALCCYKDVLVIHKEDRAFILSGNSPENFTIQPFSDLGAVSPYGITTAGGKQVFFNKQIYPFSVNELGEIVQESAISLIIENRFKDFENVKNKESILLNYKTKSQLWCFLYRENQDYFDTILIYDYVRNAWFQRVLPYKITSAWEYDGLIYTGLADGRIVIEDSGTSFLGEPINFSWTTPFFHFGHVNNNKTVEKLFLVFASDKDNNFKFQVRKNYSEYEIFDKRTFTNLNTNTLIYCDADGNRGNGVLDSEDTQYGFISMPAQKVENYLANVTGENKSIQIELYGNELGHSLALLGIEFREVYINA